jgi:hypothetical protein
MTPGEQGTGQQPSAQGTTPAHPTPMKHSRALALLRPFCSERNERYARTRPFVRSGWLYATDGRVLTC